MLCALNFKTGSARELGTGCVHIEGGQEVPGICKGERWRAEKMLVKRVLLVFLGVVLVVSSGGTRAWREVLGSTRGCGHGSYFGLGSGIDGYVDLNDFSIWMTHIRGAVTAVMTMIPTIALMAIIAMIPMMAVIPMMAMFPMMAVPIMAMPLGMIHHITQQDQNIHNSLIRVLVSRRCCPDICSGVVGASVGGGQGPRKASPTGTVPTLNTYLP
eukprot:1393626-Amorphochlora_amoeboformis.AAC.1